MINCSLEPDLLLYTILMSGKLSSESLTKFKICLEQIEWENILSTYIAVFCQRFSFLIRLNQLGLRAFFHLEPLAHSICSEQIEWSLRGFITSQVQSICSEQNQWDLRGCFDILIIINYYMKY